MKIVEEIDNLIEFLFIYFDKNIWFVEIDHFKIILLSNFEGAKYYLSVVESCVIRLKKNLIKI